MDLVVRPFDAAAFAPYGAVLSTEGAERRLINGDTTERFHALAAADAGSEGGRTIISIFRGQPRRFPYEVGMMERHPLGSQAFYPLSGRAWIAIIAPDRDGRPGPPEAFLVDGRTGLQYGRNVWHHPLVAVDEISEFLVIDRDGPGNNLEEAGYPEPYRLLAP